MPHAVDPDLMQTSDHQEQNPASSGRQSGSVHCGMLGVIFRPYGLKSTVPNGYLPSTTLTPTLTLNLTLTPTLTLNDPRGPLTLYDPRAP